MLRQLHRLEFESPATENFIDIDGHTYATGKDGKGLYKLIPPEKAYFYNEATLISEEFKYDKREDLGKAIKAELSNLTSLEN